MLEEKRDLSRIEIVNGMFIEVEHELSVFKDGAMFASKKHRRALSPGENVDDQPELVQKISQLVWTAEVIASYKAQQEARRVG